LTFAGWGSVLADLGGLIAENHEGLSQGPDASHTNCHGSCYSTTMDDALIPSLSGGVVGSRFVTEDQVETAKARREEQWKAAYARLVAQKSIAYIY